MSDYFVDSREESKSLLSNNRRKVLLILSGVAVVILGAISVFAYFQSQDSGDDTDRETFASRNIVTGAAGEITIVPDNEFDTSVSETYSCQACNYDCGICVPFQGVNPDCSAIPASVSAQINTCGTNTCVQTDNCVTGVGQCAAQDSSCGDLCSNVNSTANACPAGGGEDTDGGTGGGTPDPICTALQETNDHFQNLGSGNTCMDGESKCIDGHKFRCEERANLPDDNPARYRWICQVGDECAYLACENNQCVRKENSQDTGGLSSSSNSLTDASCQGLGEGDSCGVTTTNTINGGVGNVICSDEGICRVRGWTCTPDFPDETLSVQVFVDDVVNQSASRSTDGTVTPGLLRTIENDETNLLREEAVGSNCGGNRNHGFEFQFPNAYRDGSAYNFIFRSRYDFNGDGDFADADERVVIGDEDKTYNCSDAQCEVTATAVSNDCYECNLSTNSCSLVTGVPGACQNQNSNYYANATTCATECAPAPTHLECVNNACTVVAGDSADQDGCLSAGDACGTAPVSNTCYVCDSSSNTCSEQPGFSGPCSAQSSDGPRIHFANENTCSSLCVPVVPTSVCGDGVVDTSAGEECDPPDGLTCSSDCKLVPEQCLSIRESGSDPIANGAGNVVTYVLKYQHVSTTNPYPNIALRVGGVGSEVGRNFQSPSDNFVTPSGVSYNADTATWRYAFKWEAADVGADTTTDGTYDVAVYRNGDSREIVSSDCQDQITVDAAATAEPSYSIVKEATGFCSEGVNYTVNYTITVTNDNQNVGGTIDFVEDEFDSRFATFGVQPTSISGSGTVSSGVIRWEDTDSITFAAGETKTYTYTAVIPDANLASFTEGVNNDVTVQFDLIGQTDNTTTFEHNHQFSCGGVTTVGGAIPDTAIGDGPTIYIIFALLLLGTGVVVYRSRVVGDWFELTWAKTYGKNSQEEFEKRMRGNNS